MKNANAVLSASDERPNTKNGFSDAVFCGDNGNGKKCHVISNEDKNVGEPMYPLGMGNFVFIFVRQIYRQGNFNRGLTGNV